MKSRQRSLSRAVPVSARTLRLLRAIPHAEPILTQRSLNDNFFQRYSDTLRSGLDLYEQALADAKYYGLNSIDPDFDFDEFGDYADELPCHVRVMDEDDYILNEISEL